MGNKRVFLEKGFGFCVVENSDGKIVSEAVSPAISRRFIDIDIHTNVVYRGKGLAKAAAKAFIDHALNLNLIPKWACDESNTASLKLAESLVLV